MEKYGSVWKSTEKYRKYLAHTHTHGAEPVVRVTCVVQTLLAKATACCALHESYGLCTVGFEAESFNSVCPNH